MQIFILTIFPEFFETPLQSSMLKRAQAKGEVEIKIINLRDFTADKHRTTDDRPFGGGPGMVMKIEPIYEALKSLNSLNPGQPKVKTVLTSAKGKLFNQQTAREYSNLEKIVIICGHYEGVDERVAEHLVDEEVRIGDYVLTGGEAAALVMVDSVVRLVPGVLGNEESNVDESHTHPGQLGHPTYTRPEEFNGWKVPDILLSGHQAKIDEWRDQQKKTTE